MHQQPSFEQQVDQKVIDTLVKTYYSKWHLKKEYAVFVSPLRLSVDSISIPAIRSSIAKNVSIDFKPFSSENEVTYELKKGHPNVKNLAFLPVSDVEHKNLLGIIQLSKLYTNASKSKFYCFAGFKRENALETFFVFELSQYKDRIELDAMKQLPLTEFYWEGSVRMFFTRGSS